MSQRIFVVEDHEDNRQILRDMLSAAGYEMIEAHDGEQALAAIPIIAVTSYALSGDEATALAAGCNAYVAKPFSPHQLLAKIREFLPP